MLLVLMSQQVLACLIESIHTYLTTHFSLSRSLSMPNHGHQMAMFIEYWVVPLVAFAKSSAINHLAWHYLFKKLVPDTFPCRHQL
jgi:hypothetical protein